MPGQGQSVLHQLMSASVSALNDCLALLGPDDEVLLVGEGVEWLRDPALPDRLSGAARVIALAADLAAHGVSELAESQGIAGIDDAQWVSRVMAHATSLSWA